MACPGLDVGLVIGDVAVSTGTSNVLAARVGAWATSIQRANAAAVCGWQGNPEL